MMTKQSINRMLSRGLVGILILTSPLIISATCKNQTKDSIKEDQKIQWVSLEEAQRLTKEEPREIFIDVYTDWCGWCKVMDKKTFTDSKVIDYVNKHYYAVKLNAESSKEITFNGQLLTEAELAHAFGVSSFPTIVLINEDFNLVAPAPGYRKAKEFKKMLTEFSDYAEKNSNPEPPKDQ